MKNIFIYKHVFANEYFYDLINLFSYLIYVQSYKLTIIETFTRRFFFVW